MSEVRLYRIWNENEKGDYSSSINENDYIDCAYCIHFSQSDIYCIKYIGL